MGDRSAAPFYVVAFEGRVLVQDKIQTNTSSKGLCLFRQVANSFNWDTSVASILRERIKLRRSDVLDIEPAEIEQDL